MNSYKIVKYTIAYSDKTTRVVEVGPYSSQVPITAETIRTGYKQAEKLNLFQWLNQHFVSPTGVHFAKFENIELVEVTEDEINLNVNKQEED